MKNRSFIALFWACLPFTVVHSQPLTALDEAAQATEFAIPASPAFNMLNENVPARIQRNANLHDFKVDWSLTNGQQGYTLSPGIAIEAQPIWLLAYNRNGISKYQKASPLAKSLSTLSLSIGTNASNEQNWLSWGAKMNLYRQHDPLDDPEFLHALETATSVDKSNGLLKINDFEKQQLMLNRRDPSFDRQFAMLDDSIEMVKLNMAEMARKQSEHIADAREAYIAEHWNSAYVDLSFGTLMTYKQFDKQFTQIITDPVSGQDTTLAFSQNTLELQSQGYGVWLAGGVPVGKDGLFSGQVRYGNRASQVTGEIGTVVSVGANMRYGTRRYNFFVEGFYDHANDPVSGLENQSIKRNVYMLTFGGDWRISRNVVLSFGIRQVRDFTNGTYFLQPLTNINCLMR